MAIKLVIALQIILMPWTEETKRAAPCYQSLS